LTSKRLKKNAKIVKFGIEIANLATLYWSVK